jgi:hypothetical protein
MSDVLELLQRQAEWQKSRASLSWSEKLVLAELLRDAAVAMQQRSDSDEDVSATPPRR